MEGDILGKFEVATLEFIIDTKPPTPEFEIDLVAVTVLTQTHVDLANNTVVIDAHGARRKLNDGDDIEHAIQVAFRTVGIVSSGKMGSMTFEEVAEDGFRNHFNQYLFRLTQKDDFFSVLEFQESQAAIEPSVDEKAGSKGQFVATILLSSCAFMIALFASHYAIKKHLRSQKRITDRSRMLEYPGFTHESTGLSGSLDDEERTSSGKTPMLQLELEIDDDKIEMEDIGLTPNNGVPGAVESPFSHADERRPLSPSQMEAGEGRPSLSGMSEASSGLKKWLTPRQGLFNWMQGTPKHDPPESESSFRPSYDPTSRKVSTVTELGVQQSDRRDTIGGSSRQRQSYGGQSPLTIPMSFFSGGGDNISDASGTPMASLAGSGASSFFMKMGKSVFTGRKSMQSEAGRSDVGGGQQPRQFEPEPKPSAPKQYQYNFQTTDGADSEVEVTRVGSELNAANLARLQTTQAKSTQMRQKISRFEASEASEASQPPRPQNSAVPKPPLSNAGSQTGRNVPLSQSAYAPRSVPPKQGAPVNESRQMPQQAQREPGNGAIRNGKRAVPNDKLRFDNDSPEEDRSKRSRILEFESDTESEFSLNEFEGFEVSGGTLGARAPPPVPSEYTSSSYGNQSMPQRHGMYGNRTTNTTYGQHPYNDKPNATSRAEEQKSNFTLGAQRQHTEQATLSGTYDVFAPSGPIGIVVDTSKHGPAVHSLKATSPMLGLISPGDLIIALDEEDTRNMTAASLTRLMAKKSRQNERKITLLSPEDL